MDDADPDLDELFLDAVDAVVLTALEEIRDDPVKRFRFFRELLVVAKARRASTSARELERDRPCDQILPGKSKKV